MIQQSIQTNTEGFFRGISGDFQGYQGIQYMRPLASIYSHRVPEFMKTQVGFNPIQKRNSNPKRKVKRACRSTDLCHGRPARSTAPNRERAIVSRSTGPVDRPPPPVDRDINREHKLPAPCAVPCSFVVQSLCYLLPSPPSSLSPLSQHPSCFLCFSQGTSQRSAESD